MKTNQCSLILAVTVGSVGLATVVGRAGDVVINELMYHPGYGEVGDPGYIAEDPLKEYIELLNQGTNSVSLKDWRFDKGIAFTFPDLTLPAGGSLVITADTNVTRFKENYRTNYPGVAGATVLGGWVGTLANNGEDLELLDNLGKRVDEVSYTSEGDWAQRRQDDPFPGYPSWWRGWKWTTAADAGGRSLELVNPRLSNNAGQNWATSLNDGGTPGGSNSTATNDVAPLILDVKHRPAIPRSTNQVTITAQLADELTNGITATLHYRLDGAASFATTPMSDDGLHGDGGPADGVYGALLPAHADKSIVEFYLTATDAGGQARSWPAPTDDSGTQGANAFYQVDDSVYAGNQPIYRIIVPAAEWNVWVNLMDNVSNGRFSDAQMNGTLVAVDGVSAEVRYGVGVRNRGKGTRTARPHNLHVSLPGDRPWHGLTALSFNTRTVHSQVAGNAVCSLAGLINTYGIPVQVRVNGSNLAHATPTPGSVDSYQFGSYFCFQPYGSEWSRDHMPTDSNGNAYKATWYFDWVRLNNNGGTLSYLGTDIAAYRQAYSASGPTATSGAYTKLSNVSANDWSDLIELTRALDPDTTPDATYVESVERTVNVEEWLRYFAVCSLAGNMETTLGTGSGDDYSMYRGVADPRFQLLTHDLDTTLGQGDTGADFGRSIFKAADLPILDRFLKHPAFVPRYFAMLKQLANTAFTPSQMDPLLDQWLADWVPGDYIQSMKDFVVQRRASVLSQIPLSLTVISGLPLTSGYPRTTSSTTSLSGKAHAIDTRSVLVNGLPAVWTPWTASWTAGSVPLHPGINRVLVQSLNAEGFAFASTNSDIWFDDGTVQSAGGTLAVNTTWIAAAGPYSITANLAIASGATLTVEPGTTVYLGPGVDLTVANGGRLLAEGTPTAPIRFTVIPGSGTSWGGITVNGSADSPEARLTYAHLEFNGTTAIHSTGGTLFLDHLTFGTTLYQYLSLDGSSFIVQDCVFPPATASFEPVHGSGGIKSGGRGLFLRNFFGPITGYNDAIDFTGGQRPGPIVQFIGNVFMGTGDDFLDLDNTDAWVEGNIFLHAHKNGSPDTSSAISGGNDIGQPSDITIIGNFIYDCDHAANAKQDNFYTLINNTIVRQTHQGGLDTAGAVLCLADNGMTEGRGMYLEGNIIYDAEQLTRDLVAAVVTFTNNLMSLPWSGPGGGNSAADPRFKYLPQLAETQFTSWEQAQVMREWFTLQPGSAAQGTGPNGADQGAVIPTGVSLSGEPPTTTHRTDGTLVVGVNRSGNGITPTGWPNGSGFTHYRWRLDTNAWSAETPIGVPINLAGLLNGEHYVEVIGRNDAGWYQDNPAFGPDAVITRSRTWTVDTSLAPRVRINEVLADNYSAVVHGDAYPDMIELYNESGVPADLSGMSLSDDPANPRKFVFPPGTSLAAGGYLVLYGDSDTTTEGFHLGFGLKRSGDAVGLYDKPSNGGALLDAVGFGVQITDLSIGRLADGHWGLTRPTLGAANIAQAFGDPRTLTINEWLASGAVVVAEGFVELYNADPLPVPLGGLFLTDNPISWPTRHPIAPLSFIAGSGYSAFLADGQTNKGADHLDFALSSVGGMIGLFDTDLTLIDSVIYGSQRTDVSQGRTPDGGSQLAFFPEASPGGANPGAAISPITTNITRDVSVVIGTGSMWRFKRGTNEASLPDTTLWRATNFNDGAWPLDPAPFSYGKSSEGVTTGTLLSDMRNSYTCIFLRQTFQATNLSALTNLIMDTVIDDGYIAWLNGGLVDYYNVSTNAIAYDTTHAINAAPNPAPHNRVVLTNAPQYLKEGANVLAVQVFNVNLTSSDLMFDLLLENVATNISYTTNDTARTFDVVLNEVMANNYLPADRFQVAPDWVELYNRGTNDLDLADCSLSDDLTRPRKFVFPAGSIIPAQGYRVVAFSGALPLSATNTGFGLEANGGTVLLFDTSARGGRPLDSVRYGLQIPDYSIGRVSDGSGNWVLTQPTPQAPNQAATLGNASALRLNEWMADPASGDDWFELFNAGAQPVSLGGLSLTDDLNDPTKSPIPSLSFLGVGARGFVRFVADDTPSKGADHVRFKLKAAGGPIGLFTAGGLQIDAVNFGAQAMGISQGRLPDGASTVVDFASTATPGESNYLPFPGLVINEVLAHTDSPLEDAIEIYNETAVDQPIGGWYLSNTQDEPAKLRIADGTGVPAHGYRVIYEYQFATHTAPGVTTPFTFNSAHGDQAWLFQTNGAGGLTGYRVHVGFGSSENGVSFGRYPTSVSTDFVAMSGRTFGVANPGTVEAFRQGQGATNAYPLVGPVVINEIMYHPAEIGTNDNTIDEFIEIQSVTNAPVTFYDPAATTNTWHLRGAVSYTFPTNVILPAGGFFLLVGFDPSADVTALGAFRSKYGVSPVVAVFGPYSGKLNNAGESVQLFKPDPPQMAPHPDAGYVPYVLVDQINYSSTAPWPPNANGSGPSLQRIVAGAYGNEPLNWQAAAPTAGRANDMQNPDTNGDGLPDAWQTNYFGSITSPQAAPGADPDADGLTNLEEFGCGTDPTLAASTLWVELAAVTGPTRTLRFDAVTGRTYTIQYRTSLSSGAWQKVADVPAQSATGPVTVEDLEAAGLARFYRVVTPSQP